MVHDVKPNRLLVWWLQVRSAWGWGDSPASLRQLSRVTLNLWKAVVFIALIFLAYCYALTLLPFAGRPFRLTTLHEFVQHSLVYLWPQALVYGGLVVLCFIFAYMFDQRATKAARQPSVTSIGYCYSTVISQMRGLFALVGPMRQQARWFRLPLDWDVAVEPGDDSYWLTYNPVTSYVEQVQRVGTEPWERSRVADEHSEQGYTAIADEAGSEATPVERRELKRLARSAGIGWGVGRAALLANGIELVICGMAIIAMPFILLALHDSITIEASVSMPTLLNLVLLDSTCVVPGVVICARASSVLRVWARLRRATADSPEVVEGLRVCWTPYGDWFARGGDLLVTVQVDDGEQLLFRVPGYFMHRVRQASAGVRVIYDKLSGRVLDYRPLTLPPSS